MSELFDIFLKGEDKTKFFSIRKYPIQHEKEPCIEWLSDKPKVSEENGRIVWPEN
jgi:hypothetical protein